MRVVEKNLTCLSLVQFWQSALIGAEKLSRRAAGTDVRKRQDVCFRHNKFKTHLCHFLSHAHCESAGTRGLVEWSGTRQHGAHQ